MTHGRADPTRSAAAPEADTVERPAPAGLSPRAFAMTGDLLWLADPICLFAAAWLATRVVIGGSPALAAGGSFAQDAAAVTWVAALLAPFVLFDRRFGGLAARGAVGPLLGAHGKRVSLLALLLLAMAWAGAPWRALPVAWLSWWLAGSLATTLLTRWLILHLGKRLTRNGRLTETVAVVGAGPLAERLVTEFEAAEPRSLWLLGVFDDDPAPLGRAAPRCDGGIDDLLALGMTRRIDWIVLTQPPADAAGVQAMVQRLKSLSAPIALCPQHLAGSHPEEAMAWVGDTVPVALLDARADGRDADTAPTGRAIVPRWITTLGELAGAAGGVMSRRLAGPSGGASRLALRFDDHGLDSFIGVAAGFGQRRFGYVVTPNADHLIRLHDDAAFRADYATADHVLLDSRFVAHLLRVARGLDVPVCTGSDLTARLFERVIAPDDVVLLVGASAAQAETLRARHGLRRLEHFAPPMGFIHDPRAVEDCLAFIEAHSPFRFCLLALGSPQQEAIAARLRVRGRARGLALCVGASVNFLTGAERRAPSWMQRSGLEWLYRLQQAPRRMARRYLVRGPRVFGVLRGADIDLRPRATHQPLHLVRSAGDGGGG